MDSLQSLMNLVFRKDRPRECHYGNTPGAHGNCEVIVQPGEGVRVPGIAVFCSHEHAALDQQEAAI